MAGPRLTIPSRIFLGFVLILLTFGGVSGASLYQHQQTAVTLRLLEDIFLPLALDIADTKATQAVFTTMVDRMLEERDPTATRRWVDTALLVRPAKMRSAIGYTQAAEDVHPNPRDEEALIDIARLLQEALQAHQRSDRLFNRLYLAIETNDEAAAQNALSAIRREEATISQRLLTAQALAQERIASKSEGAANRERQAVITLALLAMAALLAGLLVSWLSQRLLAPLPQLQKRVAAVARGDFSSALNPAARNDEIGKLSREFERMVEALGTRDRQIHEATDRLRELQQTQEQIVAGLRAAVVVVDIQGVIRSANPAAAHVLQIVHADIDTPLRTHTMMDTLPPLREAVQRVSDEGETVPLSAIAWKTSDASEKTRALDILVSPFGSSEADAPRRAVLIVADDVTEALQTKDRLIRNERLAAIGRMAAHVTHEVRNPLSSIGLNVELLDDELDREDHEARQLLIAIQREIDRLTGVTEEYLRLARLPRPALQSENLNDIVEDVVLFVNREMEVASVALILELAPDLLNISADEGQIRQSLLNLLRNAREAMPEGGEITLQTMLHEDRVQLTVADRGVGIPDEERSEIFELFFSTKERGSGLGLPLTRQIMVAHGGGITCDAREGGGTQFTLSFPIPTT